MSAKKTIKPKESSSPKQPTLSERTHPKFRFSRRWFFSTALKLLLVATVLLAAYTVYLDSKVRHTFEGQRWQIPVQVFSQIEQFELGSLINLSHLKQSLLLTGYKKVAQVDQPGEFAMSSSRVILFRRAFDFGSGLEPAQRITIDVRNTHVTSIQQDNVATDSIKLEPMLLDRILPESKEDRVLVPLQSVPEKLLDTLLLVEDRNFYFHHGISPLGIMRALFNNLRAGRTVQGGSTLTQQLVKNMFLTRDKTLWRKVNEAIMSVILEQRYSKDQLLEAYINEVYLGQHYANGIYGFGLASQFYFGKQLAHLTDEQMALLIGQVKGPSYYDPWRHPDHALERRDLILRLMFEQNLLSRQAFENAVESPLSIRKNRRFVKQKYPAYLQVVKRELTEILSDEEQQSGIRVFTGFSPISQKMAEQTVAKKLPELEAKHQESDLETAMIVSDIASGEIRAVVGGRDSGYAGFNRALQANRPIGSLVKPAVYLAALERYARYNFATILEDKAITLTSDGSDEWRPKNYDGKYRGQVPLIEALVHSLNVPTVNLGMELGLDNVASAIHLLGYQEDIEMRPSMLLGALNMSPFEVNQLYLPIAAQGTYQKQHAISHIRSAKGVTIYEYIPDHEQRISTQAAYLLDYALTKVATNGTAKSLTWRVKDKMLAGKTGTSNEQRDSWFIGYDNKHLVTTWVGRDDNKPTKLTGSSGALTLFADYMKQQGVESKKVEIPDGIAMTTFELKTGNAVTQDCENITQYPAVARSIVINPGCSQPVEDKRSWFEKIFGD